MNPRQLAFAQAYLLNPNGKQAAIAAGFSPKTAESQASRLLRNVKVRAWLDNAIAARAARVEVKADDVLRELLRLAHVDLSEAYDKKGQLKPIHEMSADVRRSISGIKTRVTEDGAVMEVKFWPKVQALELLGKHLGLFPNKIEHSADEALTVIVQSLAEPKKGKK